MPLDGKTSWSRPMQVRAILGRLQEASKVLDNAYQSGRKPNATTVQSAPKDAPTPVIAGQATNPNEADLEDDRTIAFAQIRAKNTASAPATLLTPNKTIPGT